MVSYRRLLQDIEAVALCTSDQPSSSSEQGTFLGVLDLFKDAFRDLLDRPQPKPEDHAKVLAKEVQLPDGTLTPLDDQDTQIVLKLSADYKLNEVECVKLLLATHQQFSLIGRSPLEILRLTAGLYMTERRSILSALHLILKMVVLEEGAPEEVVSYTRQYLQDLLKGGLGARILAVLKDLNREEPGGCGGPQTEPYVIDARGTLVRRSHVAQRERLLLAQCRVYVTFVSRIGAGDATDLFTLLQDSAREWSVSKEVVRLQIAYTLLFALLAALVSESVGGGDPLESVLSKDTGFIRAFHEAVMAPPVTPSPADGFLGAVRVAWGIFVGSTVGGEQQARAALTAPTLLQGLRFLHDHILTSTPFQNDDPDLLYIYRAYLHRTLVCLLTHPIGRDTIKAAKDAAVAAEEGGEGSAFVSLMEVVGEVYRQEPELMHSNSALSTFVTFVGEDHPGHSYKTLSAFLRLLTSLATGHEGAGQVYGWLQGGSFGAVSWATLFNTLLLYDQRMRAALQPGGDATKAHLPEGDAVALEAYLACLQRVVEQGEGSVRAGWFGDIEPLFCLLQYSGVPPSFKGALRSAITAFVNVGPAMRDRIWQLMEHYDLPVGGGGGEEVYSMGYELNQVEAREELYPSSLSYLRLLNTLIQGDAPPRDAGRRYMGVFRFVRDQVLGPYAQRSYKEQPQKWQMAGAALTHLLAMLKMYHPSTTDSPQEVPGQLILKDLMSGQLIYRTVMGILAMGADRALDVRAAQPEGEALEAAIALSLQLLEVAFSLDGLVADSWRPAHQPLDVILGYSKTEVVSVVEYVRYTANPALQHTSIRLTTILSARCPQLVASLEEAGVAGRVAEDYAACLEARIHFPPPPGPPAEDSGVLVLQLLLGGLSEPSSPSLTHLLLAFDLEAVERGVLQPQRDFSCLRVLLDLLTDLRAPDLNFTLHHLSLHLLYQLATHPDTAHPTLDLLRSPKYGFFARHLEGLLQHHLPAPSAHPQRRISTLHQLAWLLQLAALALFGADPGVEHERVSCQALLATLFQHPHPLVLQLLERVVGSAAEGESGEEEAAALVHLMSAWAQVTEVAVCRRHSRDQTVQQVLSCTLRHLRSPRCSLRMGLPLSSVVATLMAKLVEHRGEEGEEGLSLCLPPASCQLLLSDLLGALLRHSPSHLVRCRLYAALHSFFTYTQDLPPVSSPELQEEAVRLRLSCLAILRKEGGAVVDVVGRDAAHGSPLATALAYGVLGALLAQDPGLFLSHLQSRGLLQHCLAAVGDVPYQPLLAPSAEALRWVYTVEAQLTLLQHTACLQGGKGASILLAMGALPKLAACPALNLPPEAERQLVAPLLRLLLTLSTQEGEVVRLAAVDVVSCHQAFFSNILLTATHTQTQTQLEEAELTTALLARIWPGEAEGGRSAIQELMLNAAVAYFDIKAPSKALPKLPAPPQVALIRRHLMSFLRSLAVQHGVVLKASSRTEPSLEAIACLLHHSAAELVGVVEERAAMAGKMEEVGEVSRHAVEEILTLYAPATPLAPFHTLRSRRQVAVREMRRAAGAQERQVDTLLCTCEGALETLYHHFQNLQNREEDMAAVARRLVAPMELLQMLTKERVGRGVEQLQRLLQWLYSRILLDPTTALL